MFSILLFAALGWCQSESIIPVYKGEVKIQGQYPDVVKSPIPKAEVLPPSWDWRSSGLMTTDLNQHIPTYWYIFSMLLFPLSLLTMCIFALCRRLVDHVGPMRVCRRWLIAGRY
jgi:hypothetical protein